MRETPDIRTTGNEGIRAFVPESAIACSLCGGAARAPEDIVAVHVNPADNRVIDTFVMCEHCTDESLKAIRL